MDHRPEPYGDHDPSPFNVNQYRDEYGRGGVRQRWLVAKGVPAPGCAYALWCGTASYVFAE